MIDPSAEPIAHIPPRTPIDLRPVYPEAEHKLEWELEIEQVAWASKVARGERLWAVVVEFARTPGQVPPSMPPDAPHLTRGALNEVEAPPAETELCELLIGRFQELDYRAAYEADVSELVIA